MKKYFAGMICAIILSETQAFAGAGLDVFYGQLSGKWTIGDEKKATSGTEYGLSLYAHPWHLPFSLGITGESQNWDMAKIFGIPTSNIPGFSISTKDTYTATKYGPELTAWIPLPVIHPYLKVAYLMGTSKLARKTSTEEVSSSNEGDTTSDYTLTGTLLGIGVKYTPFHAFGFFAEYNITNDQLKLKDIVSKTHTVVNGQVAADSSSTVDGALFSDDQRKATFANSAVRVGFLFRF